MSEWLAGGVGGAQGGGVASVSVPGIGLVGAGGGRVSDVKALDVSTPVYVSFGAW